MSIQVKTRKSNGKKYLNVINHDGRLFVASHHVNKRMRERRIEISDCAEVIEKGDWSKQIDGTYAVVFRKLKLIIAKDDHENRMVIVTGYFMDRILEKAKMYARMNGTTVRFELKIFRNMACVRV